MVDARLLADSSPVPRRIFARLQRVARMERSTRVLYARRSHNAGTAVLYIRSPGLRALSAQARLRPSIRATIANAKTLVARMQNHKRVYAIMGRNQGTPR